MLYFFAFFVGSICYPNIYYRAFVSSIPQASGTGSDTPSLPFSHSAVAALKGLLMAAVSENAGSIHASASPCLLCILSVDAIKSLQTTISGDRCFSQSLCIEDERKESMDSRKSVDFTLNASTTFSGVSVFFRKVYVWKMKEKKVWTAERA